MTFRDEDDVRTWLRRSAGDVWWFENKRGGTFGFPDAMVVRGGVPSFLELKACGPKDFEADPAQINNIRRLREKGLRAAFICGEKGSSKVRIVGPWGLRRTTESAGFGGRNKYEWGNSGSLGVHQGSDFRRIMDGLAANAFPGAFPEGLDP